MSVSEEPEALGNRWRASVFDHILRKGTCGISIRHTLLSNRNAENGTAQSKRIPNDLPGNGNHSSRASGNNFPLYRENNVTLLPPGWKDFPFSSAPAASRNRARERIYRMASLFHLPRPGLEPALQQQGCDPRIRHGSQCNHPQREATDETVWPH